MLRVTSVVVLALVAGLAIFVQIQQHILRWRAERLLADMRELQSHKSTWADAQKIMTRWGAWGSYEGSCTGKHCEYRVVIVDTLSTLIWGRVDRYRNSAITPFAVQISGREGSLCCGHSRHQEWDRYK
jgi:hypothetical protein